MCDIEYIEIVGFELTLFGFRIASFCNIFPLASLFRQREPSVKI